MILVLDNYDSFTYNLVQYLGELGAEPVVYRNDQISVREVAELNPRGVLISPGPGVPKDAGISVPLIEWCRGRVPVLGVCLGHQAIAQVFGGRIVRAPRLMHGKVSPVVHTAAGVFQGLSSPFTAMRYHSLMVDPQTMDSALQITAWTADRAEREEIMGLQHENEPIFGVQFHPESIGTDDGKRVIENFLKFVGT